jgi:uncharacterized protein YlxW (UPF0749 family)
MITMKICKECKNEFTEKNNRGSEQLYCSAKCRNKNTYKRREDSMREKLQNEINKIHSNQEEKKASVIPEQAITRISTGFGSDIGGDKIFSLIMDNATMTAENKRLVDKIQQLEVERGQLLAEIENLEQENETMSGDSIGSMIKPVIPALAPLIVNWLTPKEEK